MKIRPSKSVIPLIHCIGERKYIAIQLLLFLLIVQSNLFGQLSGTKFNQVILKDEQLNREAHCVFRDSKGYVWIGTDYGVLQYDGYTMREFKNISSDTASLSDNRVYDIREDKTGALWFATFIGLDKYDRASSTFTHYYLDRNNRSPDEMNNFILQVMIDKGQRVWIKRVDSGLYLLHPDTKSFEHILINKDDPMDPLQGDIIYSLLDKQGKFWFSKSDKPQAILTSYNHETKKVVSYKPDPHKSSALTPGYIRKIFEDSKGNIWIGFKTGLDKLDSKTGVFSHYVHDPADSASMPSGKVIALEEDDAGMIWIGTENNGLHKLDPVTGKFSHFRSNPKDRYSLRSDNIYTIYNDKAGTLWIGTDRGLSTYTFAYKKFNNYLYSTNTTDIPAENYILDAEVDRNGQAWYCTSKGLYRFNRNNNPELVLTANAEELEIDNTGKFWLAGDNVLMSYDPVSQRKEKYYTNPANPDSVKYKVWTLYHDNNIMWLTTGGDGVIGLDAQTGKIIYRFLNNPSDLNSISKNSVGPILHDHDRLWVGPYKAGLNCINLKTGKVTRYNLESKDSTTLSNNIVVSIYKDKKNRLWVGTEDGLNLLLPDGKSFRRFKETAGRIYSICEDDAGKIWMATVTGMAKLDPETSIIRNYDANDGFQVNPSAKMINGTKGELISFGQNGITIFNPKEIKDNLAPPAVAISDFQVFNKSVVPGEDSPLKEVISETKEITLSYNESFFTFEFAAHNYLATEKNQYAYKLEGFESDWNYVGPRRFAYYTSVPPGEYVFKVKASNNDGVWNEKGASVRIIITPPFWKTWWFISLVVLLTGGGLILFVRMRIDHTRKITEQLEWQVKERTELLAQAMGEERQARQEAEKAKQEAELAIRKLGQKNKELEQFAYVASHDMQEPLRTTSSFAELLKRQYEGKLDETADKYLTFITQASDRMKVLIKDLLDYSRIGRKGDAERVDCNKILHDVLADLTVVIEETKAEIRSDVLPVINGYPTEIKLLFQNLLTNALKFRKKDVVPRVKISVDKIDNHWQFSVEDNGIGIEKKHSEKIFIIFQRLHPRNEYEGSGIGLAHCKKIVELHGGDIRVESTPGQGTIFRFSVSQMNSKRA